jgi:hypothetical protein
MVVPLLGWPIRRKEHRQDQEQTRNQSWDIRSDSFRLTEVA